MTRAVILRCIKVLRDEIRAAGLTRTRVWHTRKSGARPVRRDEEERTGRVNEGAPPVDAYRGGLLAKKFCEHFQTFDVVCHYFDDDRQRDGQQHSRHPP